MVKKVNAQPVLDTAAVGKIIGVRAKTVSQYLSDSKPGFRYAHHPFPAPDGYIGGRWPYWLPKQEAAIRAWADARPGHGGGGGRPRKA